MNDINLAIKYFNEENFSEAENIAIEIYKQNHDSIDAIDVLTAIYLRTESLNFLKNATLKNLDLIRKIALFLNNLKTYPQALNIYKKALELEPKDIVGLNNIGLIYEELNDNDNAIKAYEQSIKIQKNYPALYNLGVLYRKLKNIEKSKTYLKFAIDMKPDNDYANYSIGMTYLMNKEFVNGYKYFLKRPIKDTENLKNFWDGKPYNDKTILVYCEYGLGDSIMFSRYFPLLKKYFAKVKVYCKKPVIQLFKDSFTNIEFSDTIQDYDYCVYSMDLPYYLNLDFENIPDYKLIADENKIKSYKEKYFNNNEFKIGIFFVGGELQKRNAKYRAMPLTYLEKLFSIPNAKFYSLQKEDPFDELKDYPNIINLGKDFEDFTDTAAALKNIDLLITIDSAPVHLAGALGVKTFLMLPYYSEWRWFLDEKITPWYKSVELFRQTTPCDWQSVVDNIYDKLSSTH